MTTKDKQSKTLRKNTFNKLLRRLNQGGFSKEFVRKAILPEWWNADCNTQSELVPDIEIRVARFLGLPLANVKNPDFSLAPVKYENAHLRRVRFIDDDRLAPAIHSALKIGEAVVRNLQNKKLFQDNIPRDALVWRRQILKGQKNVTLDMLLENLWARGIPVIPIEVLPSPNFQGIACIIDDRPIILLGQRHDEPSHVAFIIAHEAGHIAAGDCTPGQPVVDEADEVDDDTDMERDADNFAKLVLLGSDTIPELTGENYKQIAEQADQIEQDTGADASLIIFNWARQTRDYTMASMAVKALYGNVGARQKMRRHFDHHINLDDASETDRALLRCVYGDT
ncbi:MAG: hypothetical protein U5L00_15725 [Desulfovermiculus sp.]|nr:hypothetical protein [Desulfovermiculus sp.]